MTTATDKNEYIDHQLCNMGIDYKATLVRDDFNGHEGSSHWKVTIERNGRSFSIDYSQGAAYRHYRNKRKINLNCRPTLYNVEQNKQTTPDKPELRNVLHCVVSDAQSVSYGQTFEDWCGEFGCDTDSRKAERSFNACRDEYFGLIGLGVDFAVLVELFQDY